MAAFPRDYIGRMKQYVEPQTRALRNRLEYGVTSSRRFPDSVVRMPVVQCRKGDMKDDFSLQVAGVSVPTVDFADSCRVFIGALRTTAVAEVGSSVSSRNERAAAFDRIGPLLWDIITVHRDKIPAEAESKEAIVDLAQLIRREFRDEESEAAFYCVAVARILLTQYFIVAEVPVTPGSTSVQIETIERVIPRIQLSDMGKAEGFVERLRWPMGVQSGTVSVPLANTERCRSYHLEVMGPPGTYFARMAEVGARQGYLRDRSRAGQRYVHIYGRDVRFDDAGTTISASFFERPPGTYSVVAVAALVVATFVCIGASVWSNAPKSDVLALLIAAPGASVGLTGFADGKGVIAGTVTSRFYGCATVALSLVASGQYLVGGTKSAWLPWIPASIAWDALVVCSITLAVSAVYSATKRTILYWRLLREYGVKA